MHKSKHSAVLRKAFIATTLAGFFILYVFYTVSVTDYDIVYADLENVTHFLVSSSKCHMANLDPFNSEAKPLFKIEKYVSCRSHDLLSYTTVEDNVGKLYIDWEVAEQYGKKLKCCYSTVTRKKDPKNPDDKISTSKCKKFDSNVTLDSDVVKVECSSGKKHVYQNVHSVITINKKVQEKLEGFSENSSRLINVLFVGIDSISRLNFIRTMPNTYKYVEDNEWLPLVGYNKMDDNTFPNLMAIFTGMNQKRQYSVCNPKVVGPLDKCNIIMFNFTRAGYVTAYAEDTPDISTFNYRKKGFSNPDLDYYFRPYFLAAGKLPTKRVDQMPHCLGPESSGERIMNLASDFTQRFLDYPHFGFFWMNSFSHNILNAPTRMDDKVKSFLESLGTNGVLDNDIVIFLSDHGMRFGEIRLRFTGWLEERLPFIYVWFPMWFRQKYPTEYANFKLNRNKLTSPYDLHMTLQHLLKLSGVQDTIIPSEACPKCKSLLENIEPERSCEDVGVVPHWCTCAGYTNTKLEPSEEKSLSNFVVDQINLLLFENKATKCADFKVDQVISTSVSEPLPYRKTNYILIKLQTFPKAIFETTVKYLGELSEERFNITGDISRLDLYAPHSYCIKDSYLKKYCYCR